MDRERVKKQSGWAIAVSNLAIVTNCIHPKYRLETCDGVIAENGRLDLLRLLSADGRCPFFTARWDNGRAFLSAKVMAELDELDGALDIDMHHPSKDVVEDFKHNRNGYRGHWTKRLTGKDSRAFQIAIETPDGLIFDGVASFTLTRQFLPSDKAQLGDYLDAEVVRAR